MVVMVGAEIFIGLLHQITMCLQIRGLHHQVFRPVCHHIQMHRRRPMRIQVDSAEIAPGVQRRIQQHVHRHGLERYAIAVRALGFQRGAVFEPGRQRQRRMHRNIAREIAGRIQDFRVPLHIQHIWSRHHAPFLLLGRREELELYLHTAHALGHGHVERIHVHHIAHPGHNLAAGFYHQPGKGGQRAGRAMVAGNPFGEHQRQGLAGGHRHRLGHAEHVAIQIGRVYG